MVDSEMQDIENDWLSKEKEREGYKNGRTSAEIAHHKEETTQGWDSGAIYNAKEHAEEHRELHGEGQLFEGSKEDEKAFNANIILTFFLYFKNIYADTWWEQKPSILPFIVSSLNITFGLAIWTIIFRKIPPKWYSILFLVGVIVLDFVLYFKTYMGGM